MIIMVGQSGLLEGAQTHRDCKCLRYTIGQRDRVTANHITNTINIREDEQSHQSCRRDTIKLTT